MKSGTVGEGEYLVLGHCVPIIQWTGSSTSVDRNLVSKQGPTDPILDRTIGGTIRLPEMVELLCHYSDVSPRTHQTLLHRTLTGELLLHCPTHPVTGPIWVQVDGLGEGVFPYTSGTSHLEMEVPIGIISLMSLLSF